VRYFFYNHDTPVRLSFDGRTITLVKNLQFGLDSVDGRTVVVLDGFRYPIAKKYEGVLKKRSILAKIPKHSLNVRRFFEAFGHTALKYVESRAAKYGKLAGSGFTQAVAYAEIRDMFGQVPVRIMFRISNSSVGVVIYCEEKIRFDKRLRTNLQETAHAIARRLELKFSIQVGEFKTYTAQFANIMLPDASRFSGYTWTYAANWSLVE
jgi:hypothetical protein